MSVQPTQRFKVGPEAKALHPQAVRRGQKGARYSLDWLDRPKELQTRIDQAFRQLRHQSPVVNSRQNSYCIAGIDASALMRALIRQAPHQNPFYALNVGGENLQWSYDLARAINEDPTLPKKTRVTIISIKGTGERQQKIANRGRCTLYFLEAFKIEEMFLEFQKRNLSLKGQVDLILSRWSFRNLIDPAGTFAQTFELLRQGGMFLFDGFFFLDKKQPMNLSRAEANAKMTALCLATRAKLLTQDCAMDDSLNHFVLQRIDREPVQLPMRYAGIARSEENHKIASGYVTRFDSKLPLPKEALNMPSSNNYYWHPIIHGDKELFHFLQEHALFTSPGTCYYPLFGKLETALHQATRTDDREQLLTLLEEGADINERDENGKTPLHIAIRHKNDSCFALLMERGARVDLQDRMGYYPLHTAAMANSSYFIDQLLAKGADPKAGQGENGVTALEIAIEEDRFHAVYSLTPLVYQAALRGELALLHSLLEKRAIAIDEKDSAHRSLIHIAVHIENFSLIHYLIERGADLERSSVYDASILFEVLNKKDPEMLEIFLKAGANPNRVRFGDRGDLLLFKAIEQDNREILQLLLQYGLNTHLKNWDGREALETAERENKPNAIELIRAQRAQLLEAELRKEQQIWRHHSF